MKFKIKQFETYKKSKFYKNDIEEYLQNWEQEKEWELSQKKYKKNV
ncbi:hypothetical protein [Epilithonimonas sp.]|nr:hypothetical protein [Epilithonimonas sp.]